MSVATDSLRSTFGMLDAMLGANLAGVDGRLAELRPAEHANNAHWVLGHILFWRSRILERLGADPLWPEGASPELQGMKKADPPLGVGRDFATLLADLAAARERTARALEADVDDEARADVLALAIHEAYHVGQLGILRRTMGLSGAIGG